MDTKIKIITAVLLFFSSSALFAQPSCNSSTNPLVNCGFETGDFTGWTVTDIAAPFLPAAVVGPGVSAGFGFFSTAPTEGAFASLNGFDGGGPDTIQYTQDVTLPADVFAMSFDYRAA